MKDLLVVIVSILCAATGYSQENLKNDDKLKGFHFGVTIIPQLGSLTNENINALEDPTLCLTVGIDFLNRLSDKLDFNYGIYLQNASLRQRYNKLLWPSDVENGQWVPGRSYEQFQVNYLAAGLAAGLALKFGTRRNWSANIAGYVKQLLDYNDELVINESGNIREGSSINSEFRSTLSFIVVGITHNIYFDSGQQLQIGPVIEYSLNEILKNSPSTLLFSYEGGRPVFIGLKANYMIL